MSDIDRKKAEVRARLEAQAAGKKAKKGFMTPERKKKLRVRLKRKLTTSFIIQLWLSQPPIQTNIAGPTV